MSQSPSFDHFTRGFDERFSIFKSQIERLIIALSSNSQAQKIKACEEASVTLGDLSRMLSQKDRPGWFQGFQHGLDSVLANRSNEGVTVDLLKTLLRSYVSIVDQTWDLNYPPGSEPVNFDSVYRRYYDQSRIPELYEEMIAKLQEIVDSNQVDSVRIIRSLEKLIATIKSNLRGSYFSTVGTYNFAKTFFRNTLWEILSDIPVLGSTVKGLRTTLDKMDEEMAKLREDIKADLDAQTKLDLPMLDFPPDKTLAALPAPELGLPSGTDTDEAT